MIRYHPRSPLHRSPVAKLFNVLAGKLDFFSSSVTYGLQYQDPMLDEGTGNVASELALCEQ
jgi:hypothetical protein